MADESVIKRVPAAGGRVSYSTPIVIRGGGRTHLEVFPQYIAHNTTPDELALKFLYWKASKGDVKFGYPADFTLNHKEVLKLREVINRALVLAEQAEDGDYVVVKLGSQEILAPGQEATAVGRSLAAALANPHIIDALRDDAEGKVLLGAVQVSARLAELSQASLDLETALDGGEASEQWYQDWCEQHSWAFGNAYAMRDAVRTISAGDNVDALMEQTANGLRDIFELKRPDKDVLNYDSSHRSYYWSAEASKAIGQCHRYIDVLHDAARSGLMDHSQIVAYHPRAFVVLGRSHEWDADKLRALHGLNGRLHGVQLMTYDQLLAQSKQLLVTLTAAAGDIGEQETGQAPTHEDPWSSPGEDPWEPRVVPKW